MCHLLPGEDFGGGRVAKGAGGTREEHLHVFATHRPAVPCRCACTLPEQVLGLASGERVDVAQASGGLREGDVGEEAEPGIDGGEGCGGDDIADDEEDVDGKSKQW